MLDRRKAIATLLAKRPDDLVIVSGLGSTTYDVASVGAQAYLSVAQELIGRTSTRRQPSALHNVDMPVTTGGSEHTV